MPLLRLLARIWTIILGGVVLILLSALAARLLMPLSPWAQTPSLTTVDPPDGAVGVPPRDPLVMRFSTPMNRATTEAAFQLDPPVAGQLIWSPDGRSLTFHPAQSLKSATRYTLRLERTALSHWWRALAPPAQVSFHTATQPAVVSAMPQGVGVAATTPLALSFSQPMVPATAVGRPAAVPALQLNPPQALRARWINQQTLLLQPQTALAPATTYQVTLDPGLRDLRGVALGTPFRWSFVTAWPAVLAQMPENGTGGISPRTPLSLTLAAPLDLNLARQALQITPPITGELVGSLLGTTQVLTFTPRDGWAYETRYTVRFALPTGPPPPADWSFSVGPAPNLTAFFPGQNEVLPSGEALRLVFSTPMDELTLRAGLRFDPPADMLELRVNGNEVRVRPALQPSTSYTLSLAAGTPDRAGIPLATTIQVPVRSAPARPALAVPAAVGGLVSLPVSRTALVELETTGLTRLELQLYPLDQASLLRALALRPDEWPAFQPERYGQQHVRSWQISPGPPDDQPTRLQVPVGLNDGEALALGAYYLRVNSPEGPRADLLLLVADVRLALRRGPTFALITATDAQGTPLNGLPVALYAQDTLLGAGLTDPAGLWTATLPELDAPILALSTGSRPAVARSEWQIAPQPAPLPAARSLVSLDHAAYQPGQLLSLRGFTRFKQASGELVLPPSTSSCRMQLRAMASETLVAAEPCQIDNASGTISGSLALAPQLNSGDYRLNVTIGDERLSLPVLLVAPSEERFSLTAQPGIPNELQVRAIHVGLPLADQLIDWNLRLDPLSPPHPPPGFVLGPLATTTPRSLAGQALTDAEGRFSLALPPEASAPSSFRLWAHSSTEAGYAAAATAGTLGARPTYLALRLPSRLVATDERSNLELLALDERGQAVPGKPMRVEIFRVGSSSAPLLVRQATAGNDGRATIQLVQLNPGEYEVLADAGGPPTRTQLWVYGRRFSQWQSDGGRIAVVADRDSYRPGEVARLLIAAPVTSGSLVLTLERGELLRTERMALRPGQVITLPISADLAPGLSVTALVDSGDRWLAGATSLTVEAALPPLELELALPATTFLPGTTAPFTITTSAGGTLVASELLVTIGPEAIPIPDVGLERFSPGPLYTSVAAAFGIPGPPPATPSGPARTLDTASATVHEIVRREGLNRGLISLPDEPGNWHISVYAIDDTGRVAVASSLITTSQPLNYALRAPSHLTSDDRADLHLRLEQHGPLTREVSLRINTSGLQLTPATPLTQTLSLAPGAVVQVGRQLAARGGFAEAQLNLSLSGPEGERYLSRRMLISQPIEPIGRATTIVGGGGRSLVLELEPQAQGHLVIALSPSLQAALADQAGQLAAQPAAGNDGQAALALLAAGLSAESTGAELAHWQAEARRALEALAATQAADGGWGWWPQTPSSPFVTAFVLEAQVAARSALALPGPPNLSAIAYLERATATAEPNLHAYITYVLARAGRPAPDAAALPINELDADGLAYLALALPVTQRQPLLERLLSLAETVPGDHNRQRSVRWLAAMPGLLPRGPTEVTAAATQALQTGRLASSEVQAASLTLLAAWNDQGWPTPYAAARVAAALLASAPGKPAVPSQLNIDGQPIGAAGPISATLRTTLPLTSLAERPRLSVVAPATATYLLAYRLPTTATPEQDLLIDQELIDPASGEPLDPPTVQVGQLVGLRISVVVERPLLRAELAVALPGGLRGVPGEAQAPFHLLPTTTAGIVRLGATPLAPGVYSQVILARATLSGYYQTPAARLLTPEEPISSRAAHPGPFITINE